MKAIRTGKLPKADLLLTGGKLVNVFSGEVYPVSVAILKGKVLGLGDLESRDSIDLKGKYICPGFIDSHLYPESSLLSPAEFARFAVPCGVTTVIADPREHKPVDRPGNLPLDIHYLAAGTTYPGLLSREAARARLRSGEPVNLCAGEPVSNLSQLADLAKNPESSRFLTLCKDVIDIEDLPNGYFDRVLQATVGAGVSPVAAVQMATINAAQTLQLKGVGAVAPGFNADIAVVEDLRDFRVSLVFKHGKLVAKDGKALFAPRVKRAARAVRSVRLKHFEVDALRLKSTGKYARVIELLPGSLGTKSLSVKYTGVDLERDILKLVVMERFKGSGRMGTAFVKGFGLTKGAIAQSVAHDRHNIICVGKSDEDMASAIRRVAQLQGGIVVIGGGIILAELPLPIDGLMSDQPLETVAQKMSLLMETVKGLGCRLTSPFSTLAFLSLTSASELRLTEKGLFDVQRQSTVDLLE